MGAWHSRALGFREWSCSSCLGSEPAESESDSTSPAKERSRRWKWDSVEKQTDKWLGKG